MEGRKVSGHALCPASVYLEQALAGAVISQRYISTYMAMCDFLPFETTSNLALELPGGVRRAEGFTRDEMPEVFSTHTAYEVVFPRAVEYAKDYHTVQSLTASGDYGSGGEDPGRRDTDTRRCGSG